MDFNDPRIDYLLVDRLATSGRFDLVKDYCETLDANKDDVVNLWFDSAQPDGILVHNCYFKSFKIEFTSPTHVSDQGILRVWKPFDKISATCSFFGGRGCDVNVKFNGFYGRGIITDMYGVEAPEWSEKYYRPGFTKLDFEMKLILRMI